MIADEKLAREIQHLRTELEATVTLAPAPIAKLLRPVIARLLSILERIAEEL